MASGEGKLRYQTFLVMQPLTVPSPYEKCRGQVMLTTYKKAENRKRDYAANIVSFLFPFERG